MDVRDALNRRRMVRSFSAKAVDEVIVTSVFDDALRAPTAGNSRGISWILLCGPKETARYFEATTDAAWRERSTRAEGLQRAGVVAVCVADPLAYVERYQAEDKVASGLGSDSSAWPVPYWIGDAGFSTMAALLRAEEEGLSASFLGAFRGNIALKEALSIPTGHIVFGAVLLGYPDGDDHRSASLDRTGPSRRDRLHRATFSP
ncbi:MAG: nitroreductase family protein [Actinomycetes bacterium]